MVLLRATRWPTRKRPDTVERISTMTYSVRRSVPENATFVGTRLAAGSDLRSKELPRLPASTVGRRSSSRTGAAAFDQKKPMDHSAAPEHVALQKALGGTLAGGLGFPPIRGTRWWTSSVDNRRRSRSAPAVHRVAPHHRQQVLRLARTLRQGERAQRWGSPGLLAGGHHAAKGPKKENSRFLTSMSRIPAL